MRSRIFFWVMGLFLLPAVAFADIGGWKILEKPDFIAYIPADLEKGKIFLYRITFPEAVNNSEEKDWLLNKAVTMQKTLGEPLQPWKVQRDKQYGGWSVSNSYPDGKGGSKYVGYQSVRVSRDGVSVVQMVSGQDLGLMMTYGNRFGEILADAKMRLKEKPVIPPTVSVEKAIQPSKTGKYGSKQTMVGNGKSAIPWKKTTDPETGIITYIPDTEASEDLEIRYYPASLLEGKTLHEWLKERILEMKAPRGGKWASEPRLTRMTGNNSTALRYFRNDDGRTGYVYAMAVSVDGMYARLALSEGIETPAVKSLVSDAGRIVADIFKVEKAEAVEQHRGLDIETAPPRYDWLKTGVKVKPGRYVGTKLRGTEVISRREIILYENGEWEMRRGSLGGTFISKGDTEGRYVYSQATGRIQIGDGLKNYGDTEVCVYGIDKKTGKHLIYAEEGHLGRYYTRLYWTNEVSGLPPQLRRKAKELEDAAENRGYRFVTNQGDGIVPEHIEAVLYTTDRSPGMESAIESEAYLLMKDGRVMDGIPVAPDMIDVAKSRSREPDRWGWWEKDESGRYRFAWDVDRRNYVIPRGTQATGKPIPKGTRLEGEWRASSSFASLDVSIVRFWGIRFAKDGRFEKFRTRMAQAGGEVTGGSGPMISTVETDEGTSTAVIGSNIGGGSSSKRKGDGSDRRGWYEFDGYNLTLKFDNGTTKRVLSFSSGDEFGSIWFEGDMLLRR